MSSLEPAIDRSVEAAAPAGGSLGELRQCRADAPSRRCYHRPSLRQFFRSTLRRARWGLFFALVLAAPILLCVAPFSFHQ
ncbi:MAG TPA: hypothetical protein VFI03_08745 [Solirubrobacterales bacterium]|nr:hypothetical protein [Solirubrobacterales bacterium]